jgi:hypothetical protein
MEYPILIRRAILYVAKIHGVEVNKYWSNKKIKNVLLKKLKDATGGNQCKGIKC